MATLCLATCSTIEMAEQNFTEPVEKLISFIFYWFVEFVIS
jgi:hypothetical protein